MNEKIPFVDRFGDAFKTATLTEREVPPARHLRWRLTRGWRLFVVVAVVVGGAGGALAATRILSADSGRFVSSPGPAPGYTGELLNLGAPDALSVGMRDTRNIPFAPGDSAWHRGVIQANLAAPSGQGPVGSAVISTGDLHAMVEAAATCSWAHYWVTSMSAGDRSAAATAKRQIEQVPRRLAEGAVGGIQPNGLGPTIDAVNAGDVQLVREMIEVGGMIGGGECTVLGPVAVIPEGMSRTQYDAKLTASRRAGETAMRSDPTAEAVDMQVLHSPEMGAAIGSLLQRVDAPLFKTLEQRISPSGTRSTATVGQHMMRDHPLRVYTARGTGPASAAHRTASRSGGVGGIEIGAQLLGMPIRGLPKTLTALPASNQATRLAFTLARQVLAVDPLAEILNLQPAST